MTEYTYEKDADGIVTVTFDASGKSANTMTKAWLDGMFALTDRLAKEDGLMGVVLASAKKTFFAGGDLEDLLANDMPPEELMAYIERNKGAVPAFGKAAGAGGGGDQRRCARRRL